MNKPSTPKEEIHRIHVKAEKAMKAAVAKVVEEHRKSGDPLAVWRNGKVVWVKAGRASNAS